jgi:methylenetetrahydrofolate dehydrogenase (NADP+)/methenyltetrahydrofolate cyclohydrolase
MSQRGRRGGGETVAARIIDGTQISAAVRHEVRERVQKLRASNCGVPGLAVVLVGDDAASATYVRSKAKACEEVGIASRQITLPRYIAQEELRGIIQKLNRDSGMHGILVQLPLPTHLDERAALETVDPEKDVDGFTYANIGRLVENRARFVPCTPAGILELLDREQIEIAGKNAVVVGRSEIVGKPVAMLLLHRNATVTICHSRTHDLPAATRRADILIAAVGRPRLITGEMVKTGAVVIDVGINRVEGKLIGDVDFDAVAPVASAITPVPGGVGPMTVAMLLRNTLRAFESGLRLDPADRPA